MSNKPLSIKLYLSKPLSARYWETLRVPMNGWCLIQNLSTTDTIRMHWDSCGDDNSVYESILPRHTKPFQVDEGDDIWMSSAVLNTQVHVEVAKYKPVIQEYNFTADASVVNNAFSDTGVAITTTYDATTLAKGYGTYWQVACDVAGFTGVAQWSKDGGVTYSSNIVLDTTDPTKLVFSENVVFTHLKVTVTAGTFTVYYR